MTSTASPPPVAAEDQSLCQGVGHRDGAARQHWDQVYEAACVDEKWLARFHGEEDVLTASTAAELGVLIVQDYSERQVSARSRSSPAGSDGPSMGHGERALRQLRDDGVI